MSKNAANEWEAPAGATHGLLTNQGWLIEDPGNTPLQAGDAVQTIGVKGDMSYPANEAWFALHYFETLEKDPPRDYEVCYLRPGTAKLQKIIVTRL